MATDKKRSGSGMQVTFWGVRGSIPTPHAPADIEAKVFKILQQAKGKDIKNDTAIRAFMRSLPRHVRGSIGGNTSCVQVSTDRHQVILDAGSGIKKLGAELMKQGFGTGNGEAHIFITHTHWDHIQGFPFFLPAFIPGNKIFIYSAHPDIEKRFREQNRFEFFPVTFDQLGATITFVQLKPGETVTIKGGMKVSNIELNHPGKAFGYRVSHKGGTVIYGTDVEYTEMTEESINRYITFYKNADVFITDSQYTLEETFNKRYWGHSSALMSLEIALKAHIKKMVLFHHEPEYDDATIYSILEQAEKYRKYIPGGTKCKVFLGYEGLKIRI